MTNANSAKSWLLAELGGDKAPTPPPHTKHTHTLTHTHTRPPVSQSVSQSDTPRSTRGRAHTPHTRCARVARQPTRGALSPDVALGPDCWTHNTQLTGQLTRWRCIVGFSGTDTGEEGGAQGRGHRTHELISQPAPGAVARASAGVFGPAVWPRRQATDPPAEPSSRIRDPRRLSEEIRRGADRVLAADHRVHDDVRGEGVQLRHDAVVAQCRIAVCGTPAATRARR